MPGRRTGRKGHAWKSLDWVRATIGRNDFSNLRRALNGPTLVRSTATSTRVLWAFSWPRATAWKEGIEAKRSAVGGFIRLLSAPPRVLDSARGFLRSLGHRLWLGKLVTVSLVWAFLPLGDTKNEPAAGPAAGVPRDSLDPWDVLAGGISRHLQLGSHEFGRA